MSKWRVVTVVALGLALAACGGDGNGDGKGGGAKAAGPAGNYSLDMGVMEKTFQDFVEANVPEPNREEAMKEIMEGLSIDVALKADGTYAVTGRTPNGPVDEKGTWKQDGDKISFTKTYEDGEDLETPETRTGTIRDGKIHYRPDDDMPFDLVFKK